ncbi:MAG: SAM-dependent methyltransferase [Saprospiraceae bacterium]|nr:SAM-dependent methyltransferase [Saprospiraceae bacterium]
MTEQFLQHFRQAFEAGHLRKCTLSHPTSAAPEGLKNVYLRPVTLKKGGHIAFNFRYKTRDEVHNFLPDDALSQLEILLGAQFSQADLLTTTRDFTLQFDKQGRARLRDKKPAQTVDTPLPPATHNRDKHRLLDPAAPWLHLLGITSAKGEVLAAAQDKWRQINKYLETIESLLRDSPLPRGAHIADMGSGKGYLSFALYDYLANQLGISPQITGIELRPHLVAHCNEAAKKSGFEGLTFIAQDIAQYRPERLDMLIALHACDTATDLALAAGIRQKAAIIVAAPCCHKQIRREMQAHNEMAPLLRHGILLERQAELLTDGIRALLLESEGYQTRVFEFISSEHTAKNVMITATAIARPAPTRKRDALAKIAALKTGFGIREHWLEKLLVEG